jgi:hypothetical protein
MFKMVDGRIAIAQVVWISLTAPFSLMFFDGIIARL